MDVDLYDTEVLAVREVGERLRRSVGATRGLEAFRREAVERFAEIGLVAQVTVYEQHTRQGPVYHPEIAIVGRTEPRAFDHDRMRAEVQANVAGRPGHDDVSPLVVSVPRSLPS